MTPGTARRRISELDPALNDLKPTLYSIVRLHAAILFNGPFISSLAGILSGIVVMTAALMILPLTGAQKAALSLSVTFTMTGMMILRTHLCKEVRMSAIEALRNIADTDSRYPRAIRILHELGWNTDRFLKFLK